MTRLACARDRVDLTRINGASRKLAAVPHLTAIPIISMDPERPVVPRFATYSCCEFRGRILPVLPWLIGDTEGDSRGLPIQHRDHMAQPFDLCGFPLRYMREAIPKGSLAQRSTSGYQFVPVELRAYRQYGAGRVHLDDDVDQQSKVIDISRPDAAPSSRRHELAMPPLGAIREIERRRLLASSS